MVEEDSQLHVQWSPRRHHSSVYFQVFAFLMIVKYTVVRLRSDIVYMCRAICGLWAVGLVS